MGPFLHVLAKQLYGLGQCTLQCTSSIPPIVSTVSGTLTVVPALQGAEVFDVLDHQQTMVLWLIKAIKHKPVYKQEQESVMIKGLVTMRLSRLSSSVDTMVRVHEQLSDAC